MFVIPHPVLLFSKHIWEIISKINQIKELGLSKHGRKGYACQAGGMADNGEGATYDPSQHPHVPSCNAKEIERPYLACEDGTVRAPRATPLSSSSSWREPLATSNFSSPYRFPLSLSLRTEREQTTSLVVDSIAGRPAGRELFLPIRSQVTHAFLSRTRPCISPPLFRSVPFLVP
jgi:hypothetical protein